MAEFKKVFCLFAAVLLLDVAKSESVAICPFVEEGEVYLVGCGYRATKAYSLDVYDNGRQKQAIRCSPTGNCHNLAPQYILPGFLKDNTAQAYIRAAQRKVSSIMCKVDDFPSEDCSIGIFVNAAKPKCFLPIMADVYLSVECTTQSVYPKAHCYFQQRGDTNPKTLHDNKVNARHVNSTVIPGNIETICHLFLKKRSLSRRYYQFRIKMTADVVKRPKKEGVMSISEYGPIYATASENFFGGWEWNTPLDELYFSHKVITEIKEGDSATIRCVSSTWLNSSSISMQLYYNSAFWNIVTCGGQQPGDCTVFFPNDYPATMTISEENEEVRVNVHVKRIYRSKNVFRCVINETVILETFRVDVYVNPAKPVCEPPYVLHSSVVITCRTREVYPAARCKFFEVTNSSTDKFIKGEILYEDFPSFVNPLNRATQCTIFIRKKKLSMGSLRFYVKMRADIGKGIASTRFVTQSNLTTHILMEKKKKKPKRERSGVLNKKEEFAKNPLTTMPAR